MLCSHARYRFHVRRDPLFNPMMVVSDGRERQVDHFVSQHPVGSKALENRVAANVNADESALFSESLATSHAFSVGRNDAQQKMRERKMAIVGAYRFCCPLNPLEQLFLWGLKRTLLNDNVNSRTSDEYCRGHVVSRKSTCGSQE